MARIVRWIAKAALVAGVVRMARSRNRVVRGVGRAGGLAMAPRVVRVARRRLT